MRVVFVGIVGVVVVIVSFALAQSLGVDDRGNPNDPLVNERANACFQGGSLDGRCKQDLEWNAGWYLIRFERGIYTREQIPSQYAWILPPVVVNDDVEADAVGISTSTISPATSIPTVGPSPTPSNTPVFPSSTPTNTPTPIETLTPTPTVV